MGFRDLHEFNLALIAKQCWRLITEPDSLWAKTLKDLYFPNENFLQARKGSRASWAWASLLQGRDILLQGAHWQVLDGSLIRLWVDNWIPGFEGGRIQPMANGVVDLEQKVSSIINFDTSNWDLNPIRHLIDDRTAEAIAKIKFASPRNKDRLVWPFEKNGCYSVKSGYHWLHSSSTSRQQNRPSSSRDVDAACWKFVWQIKAPSKICNFIWRAVRNGIATKENLFRRKMSTSPICSICGEFVESVEHLLLLCPWVEPVWFGGQLNIKIDKGAITSMDRWLLSVTNEGDLSVADREWMSTIIAYTCWHIWKARCKAVMEYKAPHPLSVIRVIQSSCGDFLEVQRSIYQRRNGAPQAHNPPQRWSPPPCNIIKVNVDASWRSNAH
ncbi:unnamed protein product [Prunus brigantina]